MKRLLVAALLLLSAPLLFAQRGETRDPGTDMRLLNSAISKFTVKVYAQLNPEKPEESMSTGSGELVRSDGGVVRILTNAHVVGLAETVFVHFDGQAFAQKVRVIGRDTAVDLALLEAPSSLSDRTEPIPIARSPVAIGQNVYAIGYPSGNRTISAGVISSATSPHEDMGIGVYFTHQAPIAPGSSGGLLVRFDASGKPELVGINSQVATNGQVIVSVGYSIKAEVIEKMLPKLEAGMVEHAFPGFFMVDTRRANPYAYELGTKRSYPPPKEGIMVLAVRPGSSAHKAGVVRGDIIQKLEREYQGAWDNITAPSAPALRDRLFFDVPIGTVVRATILRGREEIHRTFTLERFPEEMFAPQKKH